MQVQFELGLKHAMPCATELVRHVDRDERHKTQEGLASPLLTPTSDDEGDGERERRADETSLSRFP